MRNPFRTPLAPDTQYSPEADKVENSRDSTTRLHNKVELGDAYHPDVLIGPDRGDVGNMRQGYRPAYAGEDHREIVYQADELPDYQFLAPAPGSTDLSKPRDFNSVPGHTYVNLMHGPVTGSAMDDYQSGNVQETASTPPGAYGPVVGGDDYAASVAHATFQQAFAQYSNAASDQAIVGAI